MRNTATALLLISRDRLSRGATDDLIQASLSDYRSDPDGYKKARSGWAEVTEVGSLSKPGHVAYYKKLRSTVEGLVQKMVQGKRQFNSLTELDNFLIFTLKDLR